VLIEKAPLQLCVDACTLWIHSAGACVGMRHDEGYPHVGRRGEFVIFTSPICLNSTNLCIKEALNHFLEFMEFVLDIRFVFKKVKPCKFTIVISTTHNT
jgi:hypothetical protein